LDLIEIFDLCLLAFTDYFIK